MPARRESRYSCTSTTLSPARHQPCHLHKPACRGCRLQAAYFSSQRLGVPRQGSASSSTSHGQDWPRYCPAHLDVATSTISPPGNSPHTPRDRRNRSKRQRHSFQREDAVRVFRREPPCWTRGVLGLSPRLARPVSAEGRETSSQWGGGRGRKREIGPEREISWAFRRSGLMGFGQCRQGWVAQLSPCLSGMERSHKVGARGVSLSTVCLSRPTRSQSLSSRQMRRARVTATCDGRWTESCLG